MSLIWATRGRTWGFRFLRRGDVADPLAAYERAFAAVDDDAETVARGPEGTALRILDPLGRCDAAGRTIPHDFVVFPPLAERVRTIDDGRALVWPLVADAYARVWDAEDPDAA